MKTIIIIILVVVVILLIAGIAAALSGFNLAQFIGRSIADTIGGFLRGLFVDWWWPF